MVDGPVQMSDELEFIIKNNNKFFWGSIFKFCLIFLLFILTSFIELIKNVIIVMLLIIQKKIQVN